MRIWGKYRNIAGNFHLWETNKKLSYLRVHAGSFVQIKYETFNIASQAVFSFFFFFSCLNELCKTCQSYKIWENSWRWTERNLKATIIMRRFHKSIKIKGLNFVIWKAIAIIIIPLNWINKDPIQDGWWWHSSVDYYKWYP